MKFGNELRIGLWTIASIAVLVFGVKYLKGQLHTTTTYYIVAQNVDGLAESSHIKYKGYKVGRVRSMSYDYKRNLVVCELNIDPSLRIPSDSRILIAGDLLNASTLVLELGESEKIIESGDTIMAGGNQPGLLDQAGPMLASVSSLMPKIDSLLVGLNRVVNEAKLQETLLNINSLSMQLQNTVSNLNRQLPTILSNVADASANLDTLAIQLKEAEIEQIIANANDAIAHADSLIRAINSTDGTAGKLINSDELHNQLTRTIADVDSLITDIKANPKRYINVRVFGKDKEKK
ncbi:MAG: MlaD family protein [Bacteroidales bacterium]|nr:MlaD family protein [Bacteroidales bacterium]